MKFTYSFIGPRNAQIFSLNNAENWIWPPEYTENIASWRGFCKTLFTVDDAELQTARCNPLPEFCKISQHPLGSGSRERAIVLDLTFFKSQAISLDVD